MLTATGLGLIVIITIAVVGCIPCVSAEDIILPPGVTVRFKCTGPAGLSLPTWYLNGDFAVEGEENQCYRLNFPEAENVTTATLTINGNLTCDTFNIHCIIEVSKSEFRKLHNIALLFQGHLPPPENLHTSELVKFSTVGSVIKWTPPYSSMSNDNISVDPRITQYTVYITDNYTGNIIVEENVTETQFTSINQGNVLCPMYQVSAWNAGGEGELSEPVQPHIPHKLAAGNVDVRIAASHMLHIDFYVSEPCKMRTPGYFVITVMTSGRTVNITTVPHDHQSGSQVAIRIELPQNVDMCNLLVSISAGNSAGTSLPTEIEVECPTNHLDSISTTTSGTDSTQSVESPSVVTRVEQGLIPVSVVAAITATALLVVVVVVIVWTVWKHKRKSKVKSSGMDQNTSSHSLGRHPSTTAEVSQADYESTQASSESTGTQIPVTGSSTRSDSGTWPV